MKSRIMLLFVTATALMSLAMPASAQINDRWGMLSRAETVAEGRGQWFFRLTSDCTFANGQCQEKTFDFGGVYLRSSETNLIFSGIYELSADYRVIRGESARFRVTLDPHGDGAKNRSVWISLGPAGDGWQRSGNLISSATIDLSQFGGSRNASYAEAVELIGQMRVLSIALVADRGWASPQVVQVDNVQINNETMRARNYTRSISGRTIE